MTLSDNCSCEEPISAPPGNGLTSSSIWYSELLFCSQDNASLILSFSCYPREIVLVPTSLSNRWNTLIAIVANGSTNERYWFIISGPLGNFIFSV